MLLAAVLLIAALGVRLVGLSVYSFAGDELATVSEERILFHGQPANETSQAYRLPHLAPVGYALVHMSHQFFGETERGYRLLNALFGALGVVALFLVLDVPGRRTLALITASTVAFWPDHVFRSGACRFYIVAATLAFLSMGFAWRASRCFSPVAFFLSITLAVLAVFSHSLLLALAPILIFSVFAIRLISIRRIDRQYVAIGVLAMLIWTFVLISHVAPLIKNWNGSESWGESPIEALLSGVVSLGFITCFLSFSGGLLTLLRRHIDDIFWLGMSILWLGSCCVLSMVVQWQVAYCFVFSLGPIVLAASFLDTLIARASKNSLAPIRYIWPAILGSLMVVAGLPSLVSYFIDGSRADERGAAQFVASQWRPGDTVTTYTAGYFSYYTHNCCSPVVPLNKSAPVPQLSTLTKKPIVFG